VSNGGNGDLHVSKVSPNGPGFAVTGQTCTAGAVAPGGTCTITATFRPTSAGHKTGTIKVTDDSHAGYHMINLSGDGT